MSELAAIEPELMIFPLLAERKILPPFCEIPSATIDPELLITAFEISSIPFADKITVPLFTFIALLFATKELITPLSIE